MPRMTARQLDTWQGQVPRQTVVPVPCCDLKTWLKRQRGSHRFYFQDRTHEVEIAAVGQLWHTTDTALARRALAQMHAGMSGSDPATAPRLLAGVAFDPATAWAAYGARRFWLPEAELRRVGDRTWLILYHRDSVPVPEAWLPEASALAEPPLRLDMPLVTLQHSVSRADWARRVDRVLEQIRQGRLHKAVLSRCTRVRPAVAVEGLDWLRFWGARNPGSYQFWYAPRPQDSFFGCSPERLFRLQGTELRTEALAATIARGRDPEQDRHLARTLHQDDKSRRENDWVAQAIRAQLATLCSGLDVAESLDTVRLSRIQHLRRRMGGTLRPDRDAFDVLDALHPTPAVAGTPTVDARALIRELDGYPRGWYAGAIGWVGADAAEFSVAIRSARRCGAQLCLYTGAGIVDGSDPDREWQELDDKLASLLPEV